jgi:hypothetical protein
MCPGYLQRLKNPVFESTHDLLTLLPSLRRRSNLC